MKIALLSIICSFLPVPAFADVNIGVIGNFVGGGIATINTSMQGYILFGSDNVKIGPVVHYAASHKSFRRGQIVGGGIRFGSQSFLQLDAGNLEERHFDQTYSGQGGSILAGHIFNSFTIAFMVKYMSFDVGEETVSRYDLLPVIGLEL